MLCFSCINGPPVRLFMVRWRDWLTGSDASDKVEICSLRHVELWGSNKSVDDLVIPEHLFENQWSRKLGKLKANMVMGQCSITHCVHEWSWWSGVISTQKWIPSLWGFCPFLYKCKVLAWETGWKALILEGEEPLFIPPTPPAPHLPSPLCLSGLSVWLPVWPHSPKIMHTPSLLWLYVPQVYLPAEDFFRFYIFFCRKCLFSCSSLLLCSVKGEKP